MASIFAEEIVLDNFYAGVGRGDLLGQMTNAVEEGIPLLVFTGSEGSGKTMICRMLERRCSVFMDVIFFPRTVASFEDTIRALLERLGLAAPTSEKGKSADRGIDLLAEHLKKKGVRLLVIFDAAEGIYLATLERIRRLLDRMLATGIRMQILFAGRKKLIDNCRQLPLFDFNEQNFRHFELPPFSEEDAIEYLQWCRGQISSADEAQHLSDETIRNICASAKGKIKNINLLARKALASSDQASMSLLEETVEAEEIGEDDLLPHEVRGWRRVVPYLWWLGGGFLTIAILLALFRFGGENRHIKPTLTSSVNRTKAASGPTKPNNATQPTPETKVAASLPSSHPLEPKDAEKNGKNLASTTESVKLPPPDQNNSGASSAEVTGKTPARTEVGSLRIESEHLLAEGKEGNTPVTTKVTVLKQTTPLKIKIGSAMDASAEKQTSQPNTSQSMSNKETVDQLFKRRLHAGMPWTKGERNDRYTIQIMILTAKDAEAHFKKMLAQPRYRQEADNFYIFKKTAQQEVISVFYGEYKSMDKAHAAQTNLPHFLREHNPYAVSIKAAVAKIRK